ncbi:hypothetical protein ACIGFL_08865 [Pseudomonas sp. NPDC077649]|uniref:hypothetical protein n=1 Tax=Pseudomonas sp. NPDC077649 TaxID=3364423 RepID=UPI0037C9E4ED
MDEVWKRERRRQEAEQWRKNRMRLNWPIHKLIAVKALNEFKDAARQDRQAYVVANGQKRHAGELGCDFVGREEIGLEVPGSTVSKTIERGPRGANKIQSNYERGARLVIQYNEWRGIIQAWCFLPWIGAGAQPRADHDKDILLFYTYNPDDLTRDRVIKLVKQTLTIQRVVSCAVHASWWDVRKFRWWKYVDDRNRKGIGGRNFNLLTVWRTTIISAALAGIAALESLISLFS